MDYSAIKEGIKKFEAEHLGGEPHMTEGSYRYFVTGAVREMSPTGLGGLFPPSSNPVQRANTISYYWKLRLEIAVADFKQLKQMIRHAIENGDGTVRVMAEPGARYSAKDIGQDEAFAELKKLQQEVRRCKAKHDEAELAVLRARTGMSPAEYEQHLEQMQYQDQVDLTRKAFALNELAKFEV